MWMGVFRKPRVFSLAEHRITTEWHGRRLRLKLERNARQKLFTRVRQNQRGSVNVCECVCMCVLDAERDADVDEGEHRRE